ncbi:MAG: Glycosyl transferase, family 2 [Ignavibacteriae bacterium]|nr:MAG: Glycosyl transferase, family 2 [Ignavibacteriota bacterium]
MGNNHFTKDQNNLNINKKISVIIPAYQEEKLIINILKQFDDNLKAKFLIELIVSDGGSTDETVQIAKKYADTVIENSSKLKQNISIGRNIGAANAKGDILIFLNADTMVPNIENFLSEISREMINKEIVGITCPVYVYPHEETIKDKIFHFILNIYFYTLNLVGLGMGRGECQVVRRESFIKIGGYNENIAAGEDFEMFKRLRRLGKIKFLWKHRVYESPRRYRKYGYIRVIITWLLNAISVLIFKKSLQNEWKPIR